MSFVVIIPSRYGSTRLPAKALADIHGQPLICHVAQRALQSEASRVIVATDDQRIADELKDLEVEVCMTRADHESGSERLSEVISKLDLDDATIVVNVQGDEPIIPPRLINELAATLQAQGLADSAAVNSVVMATAAQKIVNQEDRDDPNVVKVAFRKDQRALYFSRSAIPFDRDRRNRIAWHHVGIYAYRAGFLRNWNDLLHSEIEKIESLEQLRVLDNGFDIAVHCIEYSAGIGVDTVEDLDRVRAILSEANSVDD